MWESTCVVVSLTVCFKPVGKYVCCCFTYCLLKSVGKYVRCCFTYCLFKSVGKYVRCCFTYCLFKYATLSPCILCAFIASCSFSLASIKMIWKQYNAVIEGILLISTALNCNKMKPSKFCLESSRQITFHLVTLRQLHIMHLVNLSVN